MNFGGIPHIVPTIGIQINQGVSSEIEAFISKIVKEKMDYIIFMTGPGVYSLMFAAKCLGLERKLVESLSQVVVICRSFKSKYALSNHGVKTDAVPEENTGEGIAKLMKNYDVGNKNVAIVWHGSHSAVLSDELFKSGAHVLECSIYSYSPELKESGAKILRTMGFDYKTPEEAKVVEVIKEISKGFIDAITFTSPPAAHEIFKIAEKYQLKESLQISLNKYVIVVAVGPSTGKALAEKGVNVDVMPKVYKMGTMVKALSDYITQVKPRK